MAMLDHWHPALLSHQLKDKPIGIRLCNQEIVLFRTREGVVTALDDICPHRRMRLSCGKVVGDRLQCLYHGWTFDCHGDGESPATPKLYASVPRFDVCERHGAVWVKSARSNPAFPKFEVDGYYNVCNLHHVLKAPLETAVDNFCEIEHTPTTHDFFGYPLDRMHEVKVQFLPTETTVRVVNSGPCKPMPWWMRVLLGIGKNFLFHDDWTTHFSPVYSVYDHWWADPETGRPNKVRWRLYLFFTPLTNEETSVTTFAFTKSNWPGKYGGIPLFAWLMRRKLDYEIGLDKFILENLADNSPDIEGMKLSRFDRVLGLNRERIATIYRGLNTIRLAA